MPNYRRGQYDFVIDSSFRPYSFREMIEPLVLYKDAYEKAEAAYDELSDKADTFKYLSKLPEDSDARKIYEGYANELNKQAQDLVSHGLTMQNKRALSSLRKRYQGEIGMLADAKERLDKENELRRTMNAKDSSMLWGREDLNINDYLYGKTPNTYGISGTELYTRGAAAGKNASSRIYDAGDGGSTLNGYYRKWIEKVGYSKESIDAFRANASAIPELQQEADAILMERGVLENLKDNPQALQRARQSVLNGIIDGAVYQESVKPVRDEGKMSAAQKESVRQHDLQLRMAGYDEKGVYHPELDQSLAKAKAIAAAKASGNGGSASTKGGSSRYAQLPKGIRIEWDDDPEEEGATYSTKDIESSPSDDTKHKGSALTYDDLPDYAKEMVDATLGPNGNVDLHRYYFRPFKRGMFDTEAVLEIIPHKVSIFQGEEEIDENLE